ncbi:MAG TPA: SDR family oxidoreductase [Anaerolineaceae bacterium]|jgi:NAD(P)-dependent dehydrogenase (short-subunit alcohol dehydrogenase family)
MPADLQSTLRLDGRAILITGGARRLGRAFALACASAGADIFLSHAHSPAEAGATRKEIEAFGRQAWVLQADLSVPEQAQGLIRQACEIRPLFGLVNNAAIFSPLSLAETSLESWQEHLAINLTAPFLLSQAFAAALPPTTQGRIVNILDWRALRPGKDHLPYTISKAGLAALTSSSALALAPAITVNGLALGAILPPVDGEVEGPAVELGPLGHWARIEDVQQALLFLLAGPGYITGEIIHVDGGRHLV